MAGRASLLLLLPGLGCATSLSGSVAPALDSTGALGHEERVEASAVLGTPAVRMGASVAGTAGRLGALDSGYGGFALGGTVEGGRDLVWSATSFYGPRFPFGGGGVVHGGGVAVQALFRVARAGGESGAYLLGPRLSFEALFGDGLRPIARERLGYLQLGLVVRWTTFDTTGKSF